MNAREAALETLIRVMHFDAYANLAVRETARKLEDPRQKDLYARLVYGTLERRFALESVLRSLCRMKKLPDAVTESLFLGAYQILFLDAVPDHAAVSETVGIVRRRAPRLSGMVNAVLRNVTALKHEPYLPEDPVERASCILNLPPFLAQEWRKLYSVPDTFCETLPVCIRIRKKNMQEEILSRIAEAGGTAKERFEGCFEVRNAGDLTGFPEYVAGAFVIQNASSQLIARCVAPKTGTRILDACAAPGGKLFAMADIMDGIGAIDAVELHPQRTELIRKEAARLNIGCISAKTDDASQLSGYARGSYDAVLTDVPCSGLSAPGKPEIALRITKEDIRSLKEIQYGILSAAAECVRPGGVLVYSTCTWTREEDEEQIERFLSEHLDFTGDDPAPYLPDDLRCAAKENGMVRFDRERDGIAPFFLARMKRNG